MADELSDLSGASKPIEIKIFGPTYDMVRELASKIGEVGEDPQRKIRGIKEFNTNVREGTPDLEISG